MWHSGSTGTDHASRGGQPARATRALPYLRAMLAALLCGGSVFVVAQSIIAFSSPEVEKAYIAKKRGMEETQDEILHDLFRVITYEWILDLPLRPRSSTQARRQSTPRAQADPPAPPPSTGLGNFTPWAAFHGNQTGLVGRAIETSQGKGSAVLSRAADCTLLLHAFPDVTASGGTRSRGGVEVTFRSLAGLAAIAPTYPRGCNDTTLGIPSSNAAVLGKTANGDVLVAVANDRGGIVVTRINPAGAVVGTQTLTEGATQSPFDYAAYTFSVADLNGDGLADIVSPYWRAPNGSAGVAVFLSQASGSYVVPSQAHAYGSSVQGFRARTAIEDVDGDGKLDVVALSSNALLVLRGEGNGAFSAASSVTVPFDALGAAFVVADLDGDGRKDILTAGGQFLAGRAGGSFAAAVKRLDGNDHAYATLAVGDFNGDGKPDVAMLNGRNTNSGRFVSIFLGSGAGNFTAGPVYATTPDADSLAVTDLDGDGIQDLWVGSADAGRYSAGPRARSRMHYLLGKGNGSFAGAAAVPAGTPISGRPGPTFAVADFDGDGKPDLVYSTMFNSIRVSDPAALQFAKGLGNGEFAAAATVTSLTATSLVVRGDFNGDGKPDVVVAGFKLAVLLGQGNGGFGAERALALPSGVSSVTNLAVGDVNGDGRDDVVFVTAQGVFVAYADASGTLQAAQLVDASKAVGPIAAGDLNGDGRADIAIADHEQAPAGSRSLRVYKGRADGSFAAPLVLNPAASYSALTIGDLNKDGKPDLVVAGFTASSRFYLAVLPGIGDGSFGVALPYAWPGDDDRSVNVLAIGDFTFDGKPDLLIGSPDGASEILFGDGTGRFVGSNRLMITGAATHAVAADLDGNGVMDALVASGRSAIVPLLRVAQRASAVETTPLSNAGADCLFNWAERTYAHLFSPSGAASAISAPYYYRYYPGTANYVGVSAADSHVWVLGPAFGPAPVDVGDANGFLALAGCPR